MFKSFISSKFHYWEDGIYDEVITRDIYGIRHRLFRPDDLVLDVGAHIGLFSALALTRGAGHIIAIESSKQNCARLRSNLAPWSERVTILNRAIWRSDRPSTTLRTNVISESDERTNTGGMNVLMNNGDQQVQSISMEEAVGKRPIAFLKVDCEGSEYPLFYTTTILNQIHELAGELHTVDGLVTDDPCPGKDNPKALAGFLESHGFKVELQVRPECETLAYVHAIHL